MPAIGELREAAIAAVAGEALAARSVLRSFVPHSGTNDRRARSSPPTQPVFGPFTAIQG